MRDLRVKDPLGGSNQSVVRDQNARLVLSYIRRHGALPSAEIARRSGLSAQAVSNIMRILEADGLVRREEAVKGKVGKPSIPMALNASGAFGLGLNIGRRSLELVLVDFTGKQVDTLVTTYAYPSRETVFSFVRAQTGAMLARNGVPAEKVAGLGIARPNRIWEWGAFIKAPDGAMQNWEGVDLAEEFSALTGLDTVLENDATAACVAEHLLGRGHDLTEFAYFFVGTFIGGGLVLDGKIISGRTHNAAAFGPLPVPDDHGGLVQLLDVASLHVLERMLDEAGLESDALRAPHADWDAFEPMLSIWIAQISRHLATACAAITSVVEVEAILVAGAVPDTVRSRITKGIRDAFANMNVTGIEKPAIEDATIGRRARPIGAALLPIHANYFVV